MAYEKWTTEQDNIIKQDITYLEMAEQIYEQFSVYRKTSSISSRRKKMGLKPSQLPYDKAAQAEWDTGEVAEVASRPEIIIRETEQSTLSYNIFQKSWLETPENLKLKLEELTEKFNEYSISNKYSTKEWSKLDMVNYLRLNSLAVEVRNNSWSIDVS